MAAPTPAMAAPARSTGVLALTLAAGLWAGPAAAAPCQGGERIRLSAAVVLEEHERQALRELPPLRITSVNAPPLSIHDEGKDSYHGIALDLLCFMSTQLGLRFEFVPAADLTVAQKIRQVQDGQLDAFVPLSHLPERARKGLFTAPFYDSHYVVIARKGRRLPILETADLARQRVGLVDGVALQELLQRIVPAQQLVSFTELFTQDGLFQALRDDRIDVAVFNRDFFAEQRYRHELFDLEVVHTLREFPRQYRFYFSPSPQHRLVVAAFDRYLAAADTSLSLQVHGDGERRFIERYVSQRSQRVLLQVASVAALLLALGTYLALCKYRRLAQRLAQSHQQIVRQQQALEAANAELAQLSRTDALTGLANRRRFDEALAHEHARWQRSAAPLSLVMLDLDHFKRINDHYGHPTGDAYLRAVAQVLTQVVARATDLAARCGGEEFACLLPGTGAEEAAAMAERIRAAVAALQLPNALADPPQLTLSLGVATLVQGAHGAQALVEAADAQLYAAKAAGRNRVQAAVL